MHNIKKSAAIISLFIITASGFYWSDKALFDNKSSEHRSPSDKLIHAITEPSTSNHHESATSTGQKTDFTSPIISPKKANTITAETLALANINMPISLHHTNPSSLLHVDSDNQLILNHDIKVLFDYFFSSEGDLSPDALLISMQQYIQQAYPQPAAQQALILLDKYLNYKQQMDNFYAQNSALQDLPELETLNYNGSNTDRTNTLQTIETLMQERQDMREQVFTLAETDAMFGQEISYDYYMLTVAKLDADLSPTERQQQITQTAEHYLTKTQRDARKQTFILQNSPPNFSIDNNGECQGNEKNFTAKQVVALCQLAEKRLARAEKS